MKQQIAFYASTRTYQAVLAVHGLDHLVPQLHAKSLEGDWQGMADLISDETLGSLRGDGDVGARSARVFASATTESATAPSSTPPSSPRSTTRASRPSSGR